MSKRVLSTGVELRLPRDLPEVTIESQVFADVEIDGRIERWGGTVTGSSAPLEPGDPTSQLLEIAGDARFHLSDLLGDVRIGGIDITRWEFHALPHRIVLDAELRTTLAGRWRERAPRALE